MTKIKNQIGLRFGILTVVSYEGFKSNKAGKTFPTWKCICDCGNEINVRSAHLSHKNSCGCLQTVRRCGHEDEEKKQRVIEYKCDLIERRKDIMTTEQLDALDKAAQERATLPSRAFLDVNDGYDYLPSEIRMLPCKETETYYY